MTTLGCIFYKSGSGNESVREWLWTLPVEARKAIGTDIKDVQEGWPATMPLVRGLSGGLYEVRTKVDQIQYRVLFCISESALLLLHGFVKKTRTAPTDIALGRKRQKEAQS